jgi:hypothetical protein
MSLGILLMLLPAFGAQAQRCGYKFSKFIVLDSRGKNVSDVTIELIAEVPYEQFLKFKVKSGIEGDGGGLHLKLSSDDAGDLLKQAVPLGISTDVCGNPLKERANSTRVFTRVKTTDDLARAREGSIHNFGFCTSENDQSILILRISAPGYMTDYYVGNYLGGCGQRYSFALSRVE